MIRHMRSQSQGLSQRTGSRTSEDKITNLGAGGARLSSGGLSSRLKSSRRVRKYKAGLEMCGWEMALLGLGDRPAGREGGQAGAAGPCGESTLCLRTTLWILTGLIF